MFASSRSPSGMSNLQRHLGPGNINYVDAHLEFLFPTWDSGTGQMLMPQGRGGPAKGRRRMEIRKDPCCRPTNTNRARLSAPPVLEMRDGLPPVKSATSGARLRASRPTFKAVPFTCTVSVRCSPGTRGEESASSDNDTKVIEKEELARLAQAMPTTAGDRKSTR